MDLAFVLDFFSLTNSIIVGSSPTHPIFSAPNFFNPPNPICGGSKPRPEGCPLPATSGLLRRRPHQSGPGRLPLSSPSPGHTSPGVVLNVRKPGPRRRHPPAKIPPHQAGAPSNPSAVQFTIIQYQADWLSTNLTIRTNQHQSGNSCIRFGSDGTTTLVVRPATCVHIFCSLSHPVTYEFGSSSF